jgi:hypothetical protein
MFFNGGPANGLTVEGYIYDEIKNNLSDLSQMSRTWWQFYYAIRDTNAPQQCKTCCKYLSRKDEARHLKNGVCAGIEAYRFPTIYISGANQFHYFCPFGCSTFKDRYELLYHLVLANTHSRDDLKKFGLDQGILVRAVGETFDSPRELLRTATLKVGKVNDSFTLTPRADVRLDELKQERRTNVAAQKRLKA